MRDLISFARLNDEGKTIPGEWDLEDDALFGGKEISLIPPELQEPGMTVVGTGYFRGNYLTRLEEANQDPE